MDNIESNEMLYEKLRQIDNIKPKLNFKNNIIYIDFHKDCRISIIYNKYFELYINNIFYYDIEGQDIIEITTDIINNEWIFVEKMNFFNKKKIILIPKNKFSMQKEKVNKNTYKVFSINELIYNNKFEN